MQESSMIYSCGNEYIMNDYISITWYCIIWYYKMLFKIKFYHMIQYTMYSIWYNIIKRYHTIWYNKITYYLVPKLPLCISIGKVFCLHMIRKNTRTKRNIQETHASLLHVPRTDVRGNTEIILHLWNCRELLQLKTCIRWTFIVDKLESQMISKSKT